MLQYSRSYQQHPSSSSSGGVATAKDYYHILLEYSYVQYSTYSTYTSSTHPLAVRYTVPVCVITYPCPGLRHHLPYDVELRFEDFKDCPRGVSSDPYS